MRRRWRGHLVLACLSLTKEYVQSRIEGARLPPSVHRSHVPVTVNLHDHAAGLLPIGYMYRGVNEVLTAEVTGQNG